MYAVIKTGGKQYRVVEGQMLKVETLNAEVGQAVDFSDILMVVDGDTIKVGKPHVDGASVKASVVEHGRGKKIHIVKFRRRKHSRTQMGHRQNYTQIKIDKIQA